MRPGVRLGLDPGSVRVGIARSDASGVMAFPVVSARRDVEDLQAVRALMSEYPVLEIVVGLPIGLSGGDTASTSAARDYALALALEVSPTPVRLIDERLTTVAASQALRSAGKDLRQQRQVIDAAAAAVLLQHALDSEAATGEAPGELVEVARG